MTLRPLLLLPLLLLLAGTPAALAQDVDELRATGLVGERADGLLGLVEGDAPAEIKRQVQQVNRKRKDLYGRKAAEEGQPVDVYQAIAAERIRRKLAPGEFFQDQSGAWQQK